ncbi:MAG: site-2 protease family protein [Candidatus Micrarchaeota archaeon]|nr:site-2 protease family protein [Candidatus Micrarchaeota archaeon]
MPHTQQIYVSHSPTSAREIIDILLAYFVLTCAFAFIFSGGVLSRQSVHQSLLNSFLTILPIAALAVALSFILHELMHKFVAQHYGAWAEFRTWPAGLMITIISSMLGFLIGLPGATYIASNHFTKRENGIVSLAGPATNLVVFFIFAALNLAFSSSSATYLSLAIGVVMFISLWLGFFNMLPIFPLDGSKVLAWDWRIYLGVMIPTIVLLAGLFLGAPL